MGLSNQRRSVLWEPRKKGLFRGRGQGSLAEMFGFSTVLISSTQGKAQFTMELGAYKQVPNRLPRRWKGREKEKKLKVPEVN